MSPRSYFWSRRLKVTACGVALGLATSAVAVPASADPASTGLTPPAARARLLALAQDLVAAGAPGVIVRVDDGRGRPVEFTAQAGWARHDQRLDPGDEFRMGSNTKTMMAAVVLLLAAEGRLGLDDPADTWLPGKVPGGGAITLRMLLNHTSGLADYTEDPALVPSILGKETRRWTSLDLLAVGAAREPLFPPGTRWSYSNTNYAAVGAVLEKVTGESLAGLIRDRIARPLGLRHTYFAVDGTWQGRHATGYEPDPGHMPPGVPEEFRDVAGPRRAGHADVSGHDPGWGGAAGAVVSTARDWARFHSALMSGQLLPPAQLAEFRRTVPMDPANPVNGPGYGLGIETGDVPCGRVWAHSGGITGYSSLTITDSTGERTASVLVPALFLLEFEAAPELLRADEALKTAVACTMFGKPVPGK
ncbi:serine hydrolase domain-containing protein [Longispora albida]|uniref:serine hydrolase domain-containing protein n=1 Tax=Longispora albida TaxID=203523 RepID=UPI0012F70BFE|nr:serine hydrolase domain-containing protein [Longispora albida]